MFMIRNKWLQLHVALPEVTLTAYPTPGFTFGRSSPDVLPSRDQFDAVYGDPASQANRTNIKHAGIIEAFDRFERDTTCAACASGDPAASS